MFMKSKTKATPPQERKTESLTEETTQQPLMEKSFISSDIIVTGDVVSEGELNVEGEIKGNIRSFIIVIGEKGRIDGDLIGDSITVKGKVTGNIRGVEVNLHEGCQVQGNIVHEKLHIRNGAMFEGQIRHVDSKIDPVFDKLSGAPEMPVTPKQAGKRSPGPIVHASGLVPKTPPANKPSNPGNDKNPMIIKDVAMIMSGGDSSKK